MILRRHECHNSAVRTSGGKHLLLDNLPDAGTCQKVNTSVGFKSSNLASSRSGSVHFVDIAIVAIGLDESDVMVINLGMGIWCHGFSGLGGFLVRNSQGWRLDQQFRSLIRVKRFAFFEQGGKITSWDNCFSRSSVEDGMEEGHQATGILDRLFDPEDGSLDAIDSIGFIVFLEGIISGWKDEDQGVSRSRNECQKIFLSEGVDVGEAKLLGNTQLVCEGGECVWV